MYFPNLKNLREDHDLTQEAVAQILNCHRNVYRRYESGERECPLSIAIKLSEFYHISLDELCKNHSES